ncbi:hypothetical protein [Nostoc sp.]
MITQFRFVSKQKSFGIMAIALSGVSFLVVSDHSSGGRSHYTSNLSHPLEVVNGSTEFAEGKDF